MHRVYIDQCPNPIAATLIDVQTCFVKLISEICMRPIVARLKGSVTVRYIFVYCRLLSLFAKNL